MEMESASPCGRPGVKIPYRRSWAPFLRAATAPGLVCARESVESAGPGAGVGQACTSWPAMGGHLQGDSGRTSGDALPNELWAVDWVYCCCFQEFWISVLQRLCDCLQAWKLCEWQWQLQHAFRKTLMKSELGDWKVDSAVEVLSEPAQENQEREERIRCHVETLDETQRRLCWQWCCPAISGQTRERVSWKSLSGALATDKSWTHCHLRRDPLRFPLGGEGHQMPPTRHFPMCG